MDTEPLRLYVWEEEIPGDYTDGIMVAYATSVEHAKALIREKCPGLNGEPIEDPREIVEPEAVIRWAVSW